MKDKKFKDNPVNGAEERLKDLGYKQELRNIFFPVPETAFVMALAKCVSPVMAALDLRIWQRLRQ